MHKITFFQSAMTIVILSAFFISSMPASCVLAETLNDAWNAALSVDHRLQAKRKMTEASHYALSAAKSARLPSLSIESAYTILNHAPTAVIDSPSAQIMEMPVSEDKSLSYTTTASLPLFTSGRITNSINAGVAELSASQQEEAKTALDIKLGVAEAYVASLRARRGIEVAESAESSLAAHAKDVGHFFEQGMVAKNDLLAAQVALSDARQQTIRSRNSLDIAHASYNRLLHRPLDQAVMIDDIAAETSHPDIQEVTSTALQKRPELAALSAQVNSLRLQAESIRSSTYPQLTLMGSYNYQQNKYQLYENVWSAALGLKWDIFDGGVIRNNANAMMQKAESLSDVQSDTASVIELQVRQAWLDVGETQSRIAVTREATRQAEENLRVVKDRYREGVGTNTEVLDAETLRTKSYNNYYNALYDAVMANIRLHYATGEL
jgi:outer membrane protein